MRLWGWARGDCGLLKHCALRRPPWLLRGGSGWDQTVLDHKEEAEKEAGLLPGGSLWAKVEAQRATGHP